MIAKRIKKLFIYLLAQIIVLLKYNKKYIRGKYFNGRYYGIGAVGWEWIVNDFFGCQLLSKNSLAKWPCSPFITVVNPHNIFFDSDDLNNFQTFGTYFQAIGRIVIGKGTWIAPNVGLITSNHSIGNLDKHDNPKDIIIGNDCWVGMNSVILPGVCLGNHTIVGAGSVVTKSFPNGNCVIAGNPAKIIKHLNGEIGEV